MIEATCNGVGSKSVVRAFAPLLSARLHALYDPAISEALPAYWYLLIGAGVGAGVEAGADANQSAGPDADQPSAMRVLLVEDDGLIRMTTASLLKSLGHLVHEAGDGDEALALLGEWPIDLMITDVNLPGYSGMELARRAALRASALRIIFATGLKASVLGPSLPPRALVMAKPYGESELRRAIAVVIRL
jgi:CheY-like chemotaxis protein